MAGWMCCLRRYGFLPFAYVEAADILTNSALDPYGKIPEFKFSAVKVVKA